MIEYVVRNKRTAEAMFTAKIDCMKGAKASYKKRLALLWALKNNYSVDEADFSYVDFSGIVFADAHFSGADLTRAIFSNADLSGARFVKADLTGAIFTNAHLFNSDFCLANLTRVDFTSANLSYCAFRGSIEMATKGVVSLGEPDKQSAFGWWQDGVPMVQVGCDSKTLADALSYWDNIKHRREVFAALKYFKEISDIRKDKLED